MLCNGGPPQESTPALTAPGYSCPLSIPLLVIDFLAKIGQVAKFHSQLESRAASVCIGSSFHGSLLNQKDFKLLSTLIS